MVRFSLSNELAKLDTDDLQIANTRLKSLHTQLQMIMPEIEEIHDGSKLAYLFATNDGVDIEDVAHEIATVHYLHKNTPYTDQMETRLRDAANLLHERYPSLTWKMLWKHVVTFGVPVIKYSASLFEAGVEVQNQNDDKYLQEDNMDSVFYSEMWDRDCQDSNEYEMSLNEIVNNFVCAGEINLDNKSNEIENSDE